MDKLVVGSNNIRYLGGDEVMRLTTDAPLSYITTETPFVLTQPIGVSGVTEAGPELVNLAIEAQQQLVATQKLDEESDANMMQSATNPKELLGRVKPGVGRIPPIALLEEGIIMDNGGEKYGPYNWQDTPIQGKRVLRSHDAPSAGVVPWPGR
jgi:hypothetical protein